MRTVMIVDDEALVRVGMQSIIDWSRHGYEVIGVYKNGVEAWEMIQKHYPDVLLTDIRMPDMDGLELIRKVREVSISLNIIVLSSYEDFQYTRRAIQLNVQDYIIKHRMEPDEILQVLESLSYSEHTSHRTVEKPIENERQKLLKNTRSSKAIETQEAVMLEEYAELCTKFDHDGYMSWIIVRPQIRENSYLESELKALSLIVQETFDRLESVRLIGNDEESEHALVGFSGDSHWTANVMEIAREVRHAVKDRLNIEVVMGVSYISNLQISLYQLRHSAEEALLFDFYKRNGIYIDDPKERMEPISQQDWLKINKEIREFLWNENYEGLSQWVEQVGHTMTGSVRPEDAIRLARFLMNRVMDSFEERYQVGAVQYNSIFREWLIQTERINAIASWDALYHTISKFIHDVREVHATIQKRKSWVVKVMDYIEQNCDQPLRLEDAAEYVNFSENYFSQRFHQETGFSFSNYLTKMRINKAIHLYQQGQYSTEEIAAKVGYVNPNYFTKVFKKVTGWTITEFKEKIQHQM